MALMSQLSRAKVMESRPRTAAYSTPIDKHLTGRHEHAAEHGGNERARLVHYVHHGHRAAHHILSMGAEHLRQRRLLGPLS